MAHLAPSARYALAVKVQTDPRLAGERLPIEGGRADQVGHLGTGVTLRAAKRPARNGANVVFKLAHAAGIDGPVPAVVHARGDLVDHEARGRIGAQVEHLDRQHADVVERLRNGGADLARPGQILAWQSRWHGRAVEDAMAVDVDRAIVERQLPIGGAHDKGGKLGHKVQALLQHRRSGADLGPGSGGVFDVLQAYLPLDVVDAV